MVDIGLGNICNSNCVMCTAIMPPPRNYVGPSTREIFSQIDNVVGGDSITITGGEPTIRKDFFEIMRYVNKNKPGSRIDLITNGRILKYPDFVEKLKNVDNLVVISELHGDRELHDSITCVKGSFDETIAGVNNVLERESEVEMRIVVSGLNYKQIPKIAEIYAEKFKGIARVVILPIDYIGNAYRNFDKVKFTFSQIMPYVEQGIEVLKSNNLKVKLYHIPYCVLKEQYWDLVEGVTVLERRVTFAEVCSECKFEDSCPRVWKTYAKNIGLEEFEKII